MTFNVALWTFEATLGVALYRLIAQGTDPAGVRGMLAAYGTILVTDQITALAVTAAIWLRERRLDAGSVRDALTWGLAAAAGNTGVALLLVVLLDTRPAALPLLAVVVALLVLAYRAYEHLNDAHTRLERHHTFAQALAQAHGTPAVIADILDRTREILEAERAELHIAERVYRSGARATGEVRAVPRATGRIGCRPVMPSCSPPTPRTRRARGVGSRRRSRGGCRAGAAGGRGPGRHPGRHGPRGRGRDVHGVGSAHAGDARAPSRGGLEQRATPRSAA